MSDIRSRADLQFRHRVLHRCLDELIACFILQGHIPATNRPIHELLEFSYQQTLEATCQHVELNDDWAPTPANIANLPGAVQQFVINQANRLEEFESLLTAASHALYSYAEGNASPALAEEIAERLDVPLASPGLSPAGRTEMLTALHQALRVIRVWHGRGLDQDKEAAAWDSYEKGAPELKVILAAIAKAEARPR